MDDRLTKLLEIKNNLSSPYIDSIKKGWCKGKKLGFSVKEMGRIILGNCTLYTNGSSYWIVLGYNSRKTNFYGFSLTKNLKRNNFDRIKIEKITKCYNPYKIFDHKKSQVLKQLIKHFNNE